MRRAVIAAAILVFCIAMIVYVWRVLDPSGSSVVVVNQPVDLEEARAALNVPLPDEATNILYAGYTDWAVHEFMLKFEAPTEVCKAHAAVLLERHNKNNPTRSVPLELRPLDSPPQTVPPTPPLNVSWFDVHSIEAGFVAGHAGSHKPTVWIDTEHGLLYYRYTD